MSQQTKWAERTGSIFSRPVRSRSIRAGQQSGTQAATKKEKKMKTLNENQIELLKFVAENTGVCTHEMARRRGDRQPYESNLRDRLYRLKVRGLIRSEEIKINSRVIRR
jgi:predicted transcriptional regulator